MHIILMPGGVRKGRPASLTHRHIFLIAIGLIAVPVLIGFLTFRIQVMLAKDGGELATLSAHERALASQRATVEQMRRDSEAHLNALARKLGSMQAQVLRLNALGTRLTRMAGLDSREFNFAQDPGIGGPEKRLSVASAAPDVLGSLDKLGGEIDRQRERLMALESLLLDRKLSAQITPSGWPVDGGWVSSSFGMRADPFTGHQSYHEGVDIASRMGSPVLAMGDGVVSHAGEKVGYGLMVELTHESGLITRYAHTRTILVKEGDKITKGSAIAQVGSSGRSTGPHLHFEVVKNGVAVNPHHYLASPSDRALPSTIAKTMLNKNVPVSSF